MRLELRVQNIAGNRHLNRINKAPCLPAFHNDFTKAQLCVYPGTHRSTDTVSAARLYLLGNNLCTGRKETCLRQCEWQASRTGLFPNLMWGEKESIKLPPWPTSPSLLPDPGCRTASKERLGPTEVKDSTCPDMGSPWLSFFSPHSRHIPALMLAGLPEERSTTRYLFSTQQCVFWVFDLRWSFMCFMSADSILCGGPQYKSECRVWLLKIILQKNTIPYIFNFLISQLPPPPLTPPFFLARI